MIPFPDIFQKISNIFREEIGFLYGSESCWGVAGFCMALSLVEEL